MNFKLLFAVICFYECAMQASGCDAEKAAYLEEAKLERVAIEKQKADKKAEKDANHRQVLAQLKAQQAEKEAQKQAKLPQAKIDLNNQIFALVKPLRDEIGKGNGRMTIYKDTNYKAYAILRNNEFAQNSTEIQKVYRNLGGSYLARRSWLFISKDEKLEKMRKLKMQLDKILFELNPDNNK